MAIGEPTSDSAHGMYVEVGFPMPLNHTFTYRWNPAVGEHPVGYRVLVPFQKRLVTGYVMEKSGNPRAMKIKDVLDVQDEFPVLTPELIRLIHHIREKYGASLGEAIQTVIPPGLIRQTRKVIFPENRNDSPPEEVGKLFEKIRLRKKVDWISWIRKNPRDLAGLQKLKKEGWIRVETQLQDQKAKEITETVFHALNDGSLKLTEKQKNVFETVARKNEVTLHDLRDQFGASVLSTLKTLEKKGLVRREKRSFREILDSNVTPQKFKLTDEQTRIVDRISQAVQKKTSVQVLLHGVTGSGKTEVYLQAAQHCLDIGRNVLALVPEISLTPQFLERFQNRFGKKIAILHSQRSESERLSEWKRILRGDAKIVIGTRSSVFCPLQDIGLFILDEEHDHSYKQDDHVTYHAKDIVAFRSKQENAVVLSGSATPSIETFHDTEVHGVEKATLSRRIHQEEMPEVEIVDLRCEPTFGKQTLFSEKLKASITETLGKKKQVILFLNRRGYSTHVHCTKCGDPLHCPHCSITMTYHREGDFFQCHYCDLVRPTDEVCPSCSTNQWLKFGFGTQRVEKELQYLFPDSRIDRLDRDTARKKNAFDVSFSKFALKKTDILIGTQMITKGLDFENVELVGVLFADQGLQYPDFRASETTFQLLTQVIGRTGRGNHRGKAILQSMQPDHYAISAAASQDYMRFYRHEIAYREQCLYPPFSRILLFEIKGKKREEALKMAHWLKKQVESTQKQDDGFILLGPSPAPIEKINMNYRFHLFLKLIDAADAEKNMKWIYEKSRDEFHKRDLILKLNFNPYNFM